jgi:hypothetical protein
MIQPRSDVGTGELWTKPLAWQGCEHMNSSHIAALSICALLWLCPSVEAQPERDIVLGMSAATFAR